LKTSTLNTVELNYFKAVEFLVKNKFCLDTLYKDGVHYLSREEETEAMTRATQRYDRTPVHTVLDVKETELESLAFLKAVRHLVDDWLALGKVRCQNSCFIFTI
jgi:poly(A)-specific ribonuclease